MYMSHSKDDGATWSDVQDVTSTLKLNYPSQKWIGSGHAGGIQLSSGPQKGRLIIPLYSFTSYAIYSDDNGKSWSMGRGVEGPKAWGAESQIAETGAVTPDGAPILLISMRNHPNLPPFLTGNGYRLQALSNDSGVSWGEVWEAKDLPEPIMGCEGSLVYHPATAKLYFSHPDDPLQLRRYRLRVWSSGNMGASWDHHATVWSSAAGYSALVVMPGAHAGLGLLYDRNNHSMFIFESQSVSYTRVEV
jgi:sialidase-1